MIQDRTLRGYGLGRYGFNYRETTWRLGELAVGGV